MNDKLPITITETTGHARPGERPGLPAMLLEAMNDTVIVADRTGIVQYLNPASEQLLGCRVAQALNRPLRDLLVLKDGSTGELMPSPMECLMARETRIFGQHDLLIRPDQLEIPVEVTTTELYDDQGRISGNAVFLHDATMSYAEIQQLRERATHDQLTQLLNRNEFEHRLTLCIDRLRDHDIHSLLYLDLDDFKLVNDSVGHAAGNAALRHVASIFKSTVRACDTLARIGGDEFGLLMEHCSCEMARQHGEALQDALRKTEFHWEERRFRLGVSIGLAVISSGTPRTMHDFLMEADLACYAAKHSSRTGSHYQPLRKTAT